MDTERIKELKVAVEPTCGCHGGDGEECEACRPWGTLHDLLAEREGAAAQVEAKLDAALALAVADREGRQASAATETHWQTDPERHWCVSGPASATKCETCNAIAARRGAAMTALSAAQDRFDAVCEKREGEDG